MLGRRQSRGKEATMSIIILIFEVIEMKGVMQSRLSFPFSKRSGQLEIQELVTPHHLAPWHPGTPTEVMNLYSDAPLLGSVTGKLPELNPSDKH